MSNKKSQNLGNLQVRPSRKSRVILKLHWVKFIIIVIIIFILMIVFCFIGLSGGNQFLIDTYNMNEKDLVFLEIHFIAFSFIIIGNIIFLSLDRLIQFIKNLDDW